MPLLAARLEEEDSEAPTPAPTQDRLTLWSTGEMGAALSARGVALGSLRLPNVTDSDVDGCVDCLQAGGDCLEAAAYGAAVLPDWEEDHAAGHARMRRGLERAADAREPGGCTLVVTHGDCLQAAAQPPPRVAAARRQRDKPVEKIGTVPARPREHTMAAR